ncbi:unnamed protein product, partial [Rotaria sp. Silwood2]
MGMAIRKKHYLDFKCHSFLWKQLVRDQITIEDIEAIMIYKVLHLSMKWKRHINDLINSVWYDTRFEGISAARKIYEVVPGGQKFPITASNFKEYCKIYRQIEFIRQGLYSIIPGCFLSLFTAIKLEEVVYGKGKMDMDLLKRNTIYSEHYNQNSLCIQYFWTVLVEMFTEEQKKMFLKFVCGRSTLPS